MNLENIKKVHVVFKTHLDIGYTDFAANTLDNYCKNFIPSAIRLAEELNTPEDKKFVWTVGSFLIDYYLKNASEEGKRQMEAAIEKGYIAWHGLAMTTHSELMDRDLLDYNLSISARLDARFGKKTVAAKMTDVPGHTIGMLPQMADAGIEYMHIGVNGCSTVPEVPEVFVWRYKGREMILNYSSDYGAPLCVEGFDEALEIAYTGDNNGPQSAAQIGELYGRLQEKYPNATVQASTLDAFARSLRSIKDRLPVLEEEIADTWIHGVGTDPKKVSQFKELLRLKSRWLESGKLTKETPGYDDFMMNLLLITEHTWGMDYKVHLSDYVNWSKKDFQAARKADLFDCDSNSDLYKHIHKGVTSYKTFEASHEEQRQYLTKAVAALPEEMQAQARQALEATVPTKRSFCADRIRPGQRVEINGWQVKIGANGNIVLLEKAGKAYVKNGELGRMEYQVIDARETMKYYYDYSRALRWTEYWCFADFSKPGLQFLDDLRTTVYDFDLDQAETDLGENRLTVYLSGNEEACEKYGCPRQVQVSYIFGEDSVEITADCFDKDASRIPEGLWFHFNPDVKNEHMWRLQKISNIVNPLEVVRGGGRKMHVVEKLCYSNADAKIEIAPLDSPLLNIGGRNLYKADRDFCPLSQGFYFCLYDNCWGTNFKMWYEEDIRSRFLLRFGE